MILKLFLIFEQSQPNDSYKKETVYDKNFQEILLPRFTNLTPRPVTEYYKWSLYYYFKISTQLKKVIFTYDGIKKIYIAEQ